MCHPSWQYVEGSGAWGPSTVKQADFCEMHYYMTPYVTEWINSLTNLGYVLFGVYGLSKWRANAKDSCIYWSYASLILLGFGSSYLHSTYLYSGQLADEITMLIATAVIGYGVYSINLSRVERTLLKLAMGSTITTVVAAHIQRGESTIFRIAWCSMIILVFLKCTWLLRTKVPQGKASQDMKALATLGAISFLSGAVSWTLDGVLCPQLTAFRATVGQPLGYLTELHGWWHLLTGLGVYYYCIFIEYLRDVIHSTSNMNSSDVPNSNKQHREERTQTPKTTLVWSSLFSLPYMEA